MNKDTAAVSPTGDAQAAELAALLLDYACRALAHPGRRAVVELLARHGPLSLSRLRASFPHVPRSSLKEQLTQLQDYGLITALPRQRRLPPAKDAPPELRALSELAQSAVDGRQQRYA